MFTITSRLHAAVEQIATQTAKAFRANICVISLHSNSPDADSKIWTFAGEKHSRLDQSELSRFLQDIAAINKPLHYCSTDNHASQKFGPFPAFLLERGLQTFVAVPVMSNTVRYGTLALFFANSRFFSDSEILPLSAITRAVILALHLDEDQAPPEEEYNDPFEGIVAKSPVMRRVFETMKKAAVTEASVLIFGESGVGKELIARGIHNLSRRRKNAFIPVDCVALPSNLLESELFGFEKGAFTGAVGRKHGLLEFANQGTFFLDEICELAPILQAKLLRVLQERQFRRIGGQHLINVDIRVISATNRNPELAVHEKVLRGDLYFRLHVIPISVPALRYRKEDIPLLADYFINKFAHINDIEPKELAPETIQVLQDYDWPGNVRELQNMIERTVSLCPQSIIYPKDLPSDLMQERSLETVVSFDDPQPHPSKNWREDLAAFKRSYFKNLLEQTNGDIPVAARKAKISCRTLYRIAQNYKLL